MNWLAHVFLSEASAEFQLGNLLADLVRGDARAQMPPEFLRGVAAHKAIDSFTDAHPLVHRSRARLGTSHRRFSGVIIDVFYDYLLAQRWSEYSSEPLDVFTSSFYGAAQRLSLPLPPDARSTLDRITRHDLLGQYRHYGGVENSLGRVSAYISKRWGRDYALASSVSDLKVHEHDLAADFAAFFPQLRSHIAGKDS